MSEDSSKLGSNSQDSSGDDLNEEEESEEGSEMDESNEDDSDESGSNSGSSEDSESDSDDSSGDSDDSDNDRNKKKKGQKRGNEQEETKDKYTLLLNEIQAINLDLNGVSSSVNKISWKCNEEMKRSVIHERSRSPQRSPPRNYFLAKSERQSSCNRAYESHRSQSPAHNSTYFSNSQPNVRFQQHQQAPSTYSQPMQYQNTSINQPQTAMPSMSRFSNQQQQHGQMSNQFNFGPCKSYTDFYRNTANMQNQILQHQQHQAKMNLDRIQQSQSMDRHNTPLNPQPVRQDQVFVPRQLPIQPSPQFVNQKQSSMKKPPPAISHSTQKIDLITSKDSQKELAIDSRVLEEEKKKIVSLQAAIDTLLQE